MNDTWRPVADMTVRSLRELAQIWEEELADDTLPYIDRRHEMPVNHDPFHRDFVRCFPALNMWPLRNVADVTGLTIHHTLSHSPIATANYCTKDKGYPTTQYHYWVSADDGCPVYLCVDPTIQLWHDHTGTYPTTLSIGMAGSLHVAPPPLEQMGATAKLCAYLMAAVDLDVTQVKGHTDRAIGVTTVCPGWDAARWRNEFFEILAIETGA